MVSVPDLLPVLPLRETVIFPLTFAPIVVGQERSIKLVNEVVSGSRLAALVTQRESDRRASYPHDLYPVGTMAVIHELGRAPDNTLRIAVQGLERVRVLQIVRAEPYLMARVIWAPDVEQSGLDVEALTRTARELFVQLVGLVAEMSDELVGAVHTLREARQVAYLIASSTPLSTAARQEVLELDAVPAKLRRLIELLQHELAVRRLIQKITAETNEEMSRAQRDHVLRKHLETIQRELGDSGEPELIESRQLRERVSKLALPEEARGEATRELDRLDRTPVASPEHGIIRTYLDWLLKLPWSERTGGLVDVQSARTILDEDHYDLDKVKDRIVEYLAVRRLRDQRHGPLIAPSSPSVAVAPSTLALEGRLEPILCFVGPPGVGKTSLGQSIARVMNRRFVRISLGGIHDEAEIRGHRRTYIGAMPGRILQAIARAGASDPVFMLDEVDKLGVGFHGDPAAALLEVLDPTQNHAFVDTYLGVPFDLSRVLFVCTANTIESIPPALLDRMEVLGLSGYTEEEKLQIARRFLVPRQLLAHALRLGEVDITDDAIRRIARDYTRESGVRNLERELAAVLRKAAVRVAAEGEGKPPSATGEAARPILVDAAHIHDYLGPQTFFDEVAERIDRPGVATGVAWTPTGGAILFVEATLMPSDRDRLILTGMMGEVMRESAQAALSYLRSNAERLGIDPRQLQHRVVHVHVPAGAIPKDGPSAGVTILAALASQATGRPVRNDVAMTGEITLRGKVLPIGGVKEKVLAAHRAGLRRIILPRRNEGGLDELPPEVRRDVELRFVESAEELLAQVLVRAGNGADESAKPHVPEDAHETP